MKKHILILTMIPMLIFASCGDKNSSNSVDTHQETTVTMSSTEKIPEDKDGGKTSKIYTYTTKDYVIVTMEGYKEGEASINVRSDHDKFYNRINDDIFNGDGTEMQLAKYEAEISESIDISVDKENELRNGDVVKVSLKADNDRLKNIGVEFAGDTYEYTVHGLVDENGDTDITIEEAKEMYPDAEILDPFEVLNVGLYTYPDGYLKVMYKDEGVSYMIPFNFGDHNGTYFFLEADKTEGLSAGDTVTLTYYNVGMFSHIEDGYIIYPTKKEFVVDYME